MVSATPSVASDNVCKCGNRIKITGDRCDDCFAAGVKTAVGRSSRFGLIFGSARTDRFRAGITPGSGESGRVYASEQMYHLPRTSLV